MGADDDNPQRRLGGTQKMPNAPVSSTRLEEDDAPTVSIDSDRKMNALSSSRATGPGGIEMDLISEAPAHGSMKKPWRAGEVWTKNRIYGLDSTMACVDVIDRKTGRPDPGSHLLGSRLGGGRHRDTNGKVRFSYPFPLPGMEAMFNDGRRHGYTSAVERFVLRVRLLVTRADDTSPTWEEVAHQWQDTPERPPRK